MIVELRIYEATPGKLGALLTRFETVTLPILTRIGIRQIGFWTTLVGESANSLTYMLHWESLAEREKLWALFQADPEWIEKKAETERNGVLVADARNEFLLPTSFSSLR
ncbi:NIPSNAP family protein [Sphingobium sp. LB126]|uniref:NIPSNAP family protein n=1 Tax=Sphingobium sp. LB126 TaxID=1983755 RepID=UPI000C1FFB8F|nr:NIPSNAP family protein [Sphingobium sp. LB126]PJG46384.1 NIPSNAP family protein [Sphingobium sp. LB126]